MGGRPLRLPGAGGGEKRGDTHGVGSGGVGKSQPGAGGAGETMKPTSGARVAVIEREGVLTGLRKLKEETAFGKYAKAAQARMGRERVRGLRKKRGAGGAGWAERPDGPAGRWADWAESEGKIIFRIKFDFFYYSKALKNCRRRFRRNFDMWIFPKFF
jgi:hypothetical protein